jgi:hypothetical protein
LSEYLSFFNKKKDECFNQVKLSIQDTAYEQRNMDLFTKIEFDEIMNNLEKDMEEIVK